MEGLSGEGIELWAPCDSVCWEFQMPGWQRKNHSGHFDKF